jgi:hypothetical protein
MEDEMATLVMLAQASAYFGVFLVACGFLWWVSIYSQRKE